MTTTPGSDLLGRLDGRDFGSGAVPSADVTADDRSGRFWLVFDDRIRLAVKVALLTGRPLLVEGEPGSGKSSLAPALASTLGWAYLEYVITSQTRLEELTGYVDVIERLHEAELSSRLGREFPPDLERFVRPGVLWWALDPASARDCGRRYDVDGAPIDPSIKPPEGLAVRSSAVVLLDEIDKAEPDLPNNLLVPLGSLQLRVEGRVHPVTLGRDYPPLVVITSNRERDLPPAFLRRCVRIELRLPRPGQIVEIAAGHVAADRRLIEEVRRRFVPGETNEQMSPAEFVDAVRAAVGLGLTPDDDDLWSEIEAIMRYRGERDARD